MHHKTQISGTQFFFSTTSVSTVPRYRVALGNRVKFWNILCFKSCTCDSRYSRDSELRRHWAGMLWLETYSSQKFPRFVMVRCFNSVLQVKAFGVLNPPHRVFSKLTAQSSWEKYCTFTLLFSKCPGPEGAAFPIVFLGSSLSFCPRTYGTPSETTTDQHLLWVALACIFWNIYATLA